MSKLSQKVIGFLIAATLIIVLAIVGWRVGVGFQYRPPFVPVAFIIDSAGNIAVQAQANIVTEFGDFAVGAQAEQAVQPADDGILVTIRHKVNNAISDAVYGVRTGQDQITVTLDGRSVVQITQKRVTIDASQGQVTRIDLTNADANAPTVPGSDAIAYCLQLPDFQGKSDLPSWGPDFADVPVMAGSVGYLEKSFYDGNYHFLLFDNCTGATDPDAVRTFFTQGLSANGWQQSDTFPYAGDPTRSCGDPYCWVSSSSPTRYVSLEKVDPRGALQPIKCSSGSFLRGQHDRAETSIFWALVMF